MLELWEGEDLHCEAWIILWRNIWALFAQQVQIYTEFKVLKCGRCVNCKWHLFVFTLCRLIQIIFTSCTTLYVRTSESCTTDLCGALFTTYNWRSSVFVIGNISNNEVQWKWGSFNAKEAFLFAQVSAYFPHFSVPQHVCAAASKNKNLRASKPNLQQSNSCCLETLMLTPFLLVSHAVAGDGGWWICWVREERTGVGLSWFMNCSIQSVQLWLRQGVLQTSCKVALFYWWLWKKNSNHCCLCWDCSSTADFKATRAVLDTALPWFCMEGALHFSLSS